uniref:Uncharacterized protein LOC102801292 n=1 Tax=Saccoglossus kowalevskii TaxID=10224 RepID=A0ABM0MH02_SACKO|nr:PREDICTED: uncharacterized protein LOC102801292 [Saccoglossus kowalevskii]
MQFASAIVELTVWCSLKCPPQCTDGCHGTSNGKCIPCKNFSLGTSCVDSCPNNYYVEKKHHVTVTTVSPGIVSTHQNVASQPHHHDVPILPSVMVETKSMSHTENTDRNPYKSTQRPDLQTLNNNSLRDNAVYQSDVDLPASNVTIGGETAGQSGNSTTQPANQPEDNYHDQPDLLSFENICQPCHKECDCCHGPLSSDCRSCRHKKHRNDCISKCPSWTLEFNNSCYECRNECYRKCRGVDPRDCKYCKAVFNDTCMEICPTDCDPAACQIIGSAGEKSRQRHKDSILLPILIAIATGLLIFMLILVIICNCNRHGLSGNYIIPSDIQVPFQSFENVQTPDLLRKDLPDLETEEKDDKDETKKSEDHDEILNIKDETEKSEDLMKKRPEQDGVMECDGGPECNIGPETEHEPEYNAGSDIRQQTIDVPDGFGEMLLAKQEADDHSQRLPMKCLDSTEDSKCLDHKDASYPLLQLKHADVPLRSEATDASIFLVHDVKEFDSATSSLTKNGTTAVSPNQIYLDVSKHALSVNNDMKAAVSENDSDIGSLYSFVSGSEADSGLGSPLAARHKSEGISSVQHGSLYKSDSTTIQIGNISVDIGKNTDSMSTLADSACDLSFKQEFARLSGWNADVYNTDSEGDDDARWKLVPQNEMMRVIKKTDMTMFPIHFTGFKGGAAEDKWMKIFIIGKELKRGDFMYPFEVKMCNKLESDIKSILDKAAESGCKELKSDEIMICDIKNEGITMLVDQLQDGWNVRGHSSKIIPYQYIWSSEHFGSVTKVPCCSFQLDLVDRSSPEASCLVSGDVHTFQESKRELDVVLHLHSEIQQREEEAYQRHDVSTSLRRSSDTTPIPSGACCSSDTPSTRFLSRQDELKPTAMMKQFLTDHISREVCVLLDELKGDGTDWRSLAQELGVNDLITHLKQKQDIGESPSRYLLDFYFAEQCKVQPPLKDEDVVTKLISLLYKLNKGQAANVLEEFSAKHICKPI